MSKPQVTITLGRSGQVVKRPAVIPDGSRVDNVPSSGSKRSIRERLGSNLDNPSLYGSQSKNKRQRRDRGRWSPGDDDVDDVWVDRDDLRYKLMRKNMSKRLHSDREDQNNMDLRGKLARTVRPLMSNDARQHMPEPKATGLLRRIPPTRSADDLLQMDSLRKSYAAWTLDGLRRRSPDRILGTSRGLSPPRNRGLTMDGLNRRSPDHILRTSRGLSPPRNRGFSPPRNRGFSPPRNRGLSPPRNRGLSPPRNMDELWHASSIRHVDASRPTSFMSKDFLDASRPMGPTSFTTKATLPHEAAKPVARLPPPSGITPKSAYMGLEPPTVTSLLRSLGLEKYGILFQAEEVDMTALRQMRDNDLKELGIPMGPRKKILLALAPRPKRQP